MNYKELVDAARAYADRQDIEVDNNLDLFIIMAESKINRLLKTREQTARALAPTVEDEEYYCLPGDYAGMRDIQLNSSFEITSEYSVTQYHELSPEQMNVQRSQTYNGKNYYCVIANQIQVWPKTKAGCAIEMVYYRKVPNLNEDDDTNWLSDGHPDIYVAGITAEIELFAKNYDAGTGWNDRMVNAMSDLDQSDETERWSGQALVTRAG